MKGSPAGRPSCPRQASPSVRNSAVDYTHAQCNRLLTGAYAAPLAWDFPNHTLFGLEKS